MNLASKKDDFKPPSWSTRFLNWFLKPSYYEDIQGDLEEEFQLQVNKKSINSARAWYNWQIIRLFKPSMMKKPDPAVQVENSTTMFKNYLKIGWRNLLKYKSATIINLIGLSTGLSAFILIALFVRDELSYDRHFAGVEDIYRVTVKNYDRSGSMSRHWAYASAGHAERLKADYSAIEAAVRFYMYVYPDITVGEKEHPAEPVIFCDDDVFKVFDFPFIIGDAETAFVDIFSLVLTESTAVELFGTDWRTKQILGEVVTLTGDGRDAAFKVTGVIEDMPDQQHFHMEYLAPLRFLENIFDEETLQNVGGNYNWLTYVRTSPNTNEEVLAAEINEEFWNKYVGVFENGTVEAKDFYDFVFQPITDIHLKSRLEGEVETNGSMEQVTIFSIIGLLILLVACVNYMNLATSHYTRRMKEVGVRKVVGAQKSALIKQFLTESFLIILISFPLAIGLATWALPPLNDFMDKTLVLSLTDFDLLFALLGLLMLVSLIAGLYPSFFLSRINLVQALKGEQVARSRRFSFRSVLVSFQYVVTIGLIFAILVIEGQLSYVNEADPGYKKDYVVDLSINRGMQNLETFKRELKSHPGVLEVGGTTRIPTGRLLDSWGNAGIEMNDSIMRTNFRLPAIMVDEDFLSAFEIPLIAGEPFSQDQDVWSDSVGYYIINRKAAEAMGYQNPADIIGKRMTYGVFNGREEDGQTFRVGRVQGVTEDFHFESMHTDIEPMLMVKSKYYLRRFAIKVSPNNLQATLAHIESAWADFEPKYTIEYRFVDERFEEQYRAEQRLSTMIQAFTLVAVLICALGVLGMVGFVVETKWKEIGIRKVLGASSSKILYLVSNQFLILIGIAALISLPFGYWLMSGWLDGFVYRTNIGVVALSLPLILTVFITGIVISYQTLKATTVNPVECLKDE